MSGGVDLTKRQFVMIPIVENIHEVTVERMDVLQLGELGENDGQLLVETGLSEFDFPHVESTNSANLEMAMNHGWCLTLSLGQDDVGEVAGGRHDRNLLEVVVRHCSTVLNYCRKQKQPLNVLQDLDQSFGDVLLVILRA